MVDGQWLASFQWFSRFWPFLFGICLGSQLWVAVEVIKIQQLSEEQQQEREERSRCSIYHCWLRIFWD